LDNPAPDNGSGKRGLSRLFHAFINSWHGLKSCIRTEAAFRQEIVLSVILIPLACLFDIGVSERLWLVFSVFFLLVTELLNTCIERVVDRISFERHELSKEAKDIGSAAVLIALIFMVVVWVLVLGTHPTWRQ